MNISDRAKIMKAALSVMLLCIVWINSPVSADVGVITGNGQNLRQITSKTIQLVSIDVVIVPGRGQFLFDGTVPGMDQAEYACKFVLRNLSDEAAEVQVGFPVDSEFAREPAQEKQDSEKWVLNYGFIARDDKTTYHVDFVWRQAKALKNEFRALFVWKMNFAAKETRTLSVQYRIPMSMGLASTSESGSPESGLTRHTNKLLEISLMQIIGYVTETGSSWAGRVETATFSVNTEPFERYLNRRGLTEQPAAELNPREAERVRAEYPVQHPWWFRQIRPEGWQAVKGGVRWEYKDFKPKKPIEVRYYMTQIPRLPEEVDAFVDSILNSLGEQRRKAGTTELGIVRQILLATYGKEPEDGAARAFAKAQSWYAARKDFSITGLSAEQQAVLKEIDRRIGLVKGEK